MGVYHLTIQFLMILNRLQQFGIIDIETYKVYILRNLRIPFLELNMVLKVGINYDGAWVSTISEDSAATFTVFSEHYWTVPTHGGGQAITHLHVY